MNFQVGEKVIYPNHGIGVVESIQTRPTAAGKVSLYQLRILSNDSRVWVPQQNADAIGLRQVVSAGEVRKIFNMLGDTRIEQQANWKTRFKENSDNMRTGSLYEVAVVFKGLAFLARDEVSGARVWSRSAGYPGDGAYLEFHKKHFPGGLRYWRVTSDAADLGLKAPYEPVAAAARLDAHADHFVAGLEATLAGREEGTVTALYDTELFGHWWFEGPEWLYRVARKLAASSVEPGTVSEALERMPPRDAVALPEGSWGQGGFHGTWLNDDTAWIWRKIHRIEDEAAGLPAPTEPSGRRLLRQFCREKLLLESSDWPFLISTWSARDYAENRAAEHFERALTLAGWLRAGRPLDGPEEALLGAFEAEDSLFEEVVSTDGTVI